MKIALKNHQGKGLRIMQALIDRGHEFALPGERADVLLIDHDMPTYSYRSLIELYVSLYEAAVWLYPHGANPILSWDGLHEPCEYVTGYLAIGEGQKEVMRRYGYEKRIEVIGWPLSEIKPFQPTTGIRALFGPIHPLGNGYLYQEDREANQNVFQKLLDSGYQVTVRYAGNLDDNGLRQIEGIEYHRSRYGLQTEDIDAADVVVASGTLAYLAIARGKPTVMFGQDIRPHDGDRDNTVRFVRRWADYRRYMCYPYEATWAKDGDWLANMMMAAQKSDEEIAGWRQMFIGKELDGDRLEAILTEKKK